MSRASWVAVDQTSASSAGTCALCCKRGGKWHRVLIPRRKFASQRLTLVPRLTRIYCLLWPLDDNLVTFPGGGRKGCQTKINDTPRNHRFRGMDWSTASLSGDNWNWFTVCNCGKKIMHRTVSRESISREAVEYLRAELMVRTDKSVIYLYFEKFWCNSQNLFDSNLEIASFFK